jgi:hypothetical protein
MLLAMLVSCCLDLTTGRSFIMDWTMLLFALSSLAGLILVTGSLVLLWRGRIILDNDGKSVSQVDLPLGFKISTQYPVLILFMFGVFLLVFPIYHAQNICPDLALHKRTFPEMVTVSGRVTAPKGLDVYAVVDVQNNMQNEITLKVPFRQDARYQVIFSNNNHVLDSDSFIVEKPGPVLLRDRSLLLADAAPTTVQNIKTVTPQEESAFK